MLVFIINIYTNSIADIERKDILDKMRVNKNYFNKRKDIQDWKTSYHKLIID